MPTPEGEKPVNADVQEDLAALFKLASRHTGFTQKKCFASAILQFCLADVETRRAWGDAFETFGPDDFKVLLAHEQQNRGNMTSPDALAGTGSEAITGHLKRTIRPDAGDRDHTDQLRHRRSGAGPA
jgi:hypothetical protein